MNRLSTYWVQWISHFMRNSCIDERKKLIFFWSFLKLYSACDIDELDHNRVFFLLVQSRTFYLKELIFILFNFENFHWVDLVGYEIINTVNVVWNWRNTLVSRHIKLLKHLLLQKSLIGIKLILIHFNYWILISYVL